MSAVPSMNADNFVQSVLINLDPLNHKDPQLRHQALEYFNNVKNSNDGWKMCVQLLHTFVVNKGKDEIKHSCLEVIYHGVESGRIAVTASESDKSALRSSLMLLTRDSISSIPQSKLIKTKLATVFVSLVKHDFPGSWPSFFHDFISIITQTGYNPEVLEVFLRVLKAIDEDIITGDSNSRSKEEKDRIEN